ncbi:MAG: glutathione S-transferase family protein [Pseudomonadota bacterium]
MAIIEPKNKSVLALKGLHLYHSGISNCSMRVRMTLEEKGLEWDSHHLDLMKKEHVTEAYFGINPNGLVPTLVHDGQVIIESDDIIDYLDTTFPQPSLRPDDQAEIERMLEWLHRSTKIHLKAVKTHMYATRMRGKMTMTDELKTRYERLQTNPDLLAFHAKSTSDAFTEDELSAARATLDQSFADLDRALDKRTWLAGERFTLADIAWVPLHYTLDILAGYSFADLPNVIAWAERIKARPSYQSAILAWWPETMTRLPAQAS